MRDANRLAPPTILKLEVVPRIVAVGGQIAKGDFGALSHILVDMDEPVMDLEYLSRGNSLVLIRKNDMPTT